MTMITPSYLGETIEYSSLHACRSTLEDPTVSDGKFVLKLEAADEGRYIVTSPLEPELITEAETIEEAFSNARDASQALKQSRVKLLRRLSRSKSLR